VSGTPNSLIQRFMLPAATGNHQEELHHKIVAFIASVGFVVGIYSLVKWYTVGYYDLAHTSWVLVVGLAAVIGLNKADVLPRVLLGNLCVIPMAAYAFCILYFLGGLQSAHILWPLGVIVIAYLITDQRWGLFWVFAMAGVLLTLIGWSRSGHELPLFAMDAKQEAVNVYSGFLLPVIAVGSGMSFILRLNQQSLRQVTESMKETRVQTETSASLSEQLVNILQQASISAKTLLQSADQLSKTTTKMNEQSQEISVGVDDQLTKSSSVNQTLNEMVESVNQTSQAMEVVRQRSRHAQENTTRSSEAMNEAIRFMAQIQESNDNIKEYIGVITGIAEQTNLLALNAAIEAARAGEQGRGFAVVADEVRSLSVRSNESSEEIKSLLATAEKTILDGGSAVNQSGEQLKLVVGEIETIDNEINVSADLLIRQNEGIAGILQNSREMDDICQSNQVGATSLSENAQSLLEIAKHLVELSHVMDETVAKAEGIEGLEAPDEPGTAELF